MIQVLDRALYSRLSLSKRMKDVFDGGDGDDSGTETTEDSRVAHFETSLTLEAPCLRIKAGAETKPYTRIPRYIGTFELIAFAREDDDAGRILDGARKELQDPAKGYIQPPTDVGQVQFMEFKGGGTTSFDSQRQHWRRSGTLLVNYVSFKET